MITVHAPEARLPASRRMVRPLLLVGLTAVAYHESLRTLFDWLRLDTPLAHLALVPLLALLVAALHRRPSAPGEVHDREVDWIVGVALLGAAFAANRLLPARDSASYWEWRIDLLSLPVFVAGVTCLLFGVRAAWRQRAAIGFLFLVWPWPYYQVIDRLLSDFTRVTVHAVGFVTRHVPVAELLSAEAGRFRIGSGDSSFTMLVASSCSGANSVIGYGLVAAALALVSRGPRAAKVLWLATGAALVWVSNVVRIVVILGAADLWGRRVAIDFLHPYLGLAAFLFAVVVLLLLAPRFHVELFVRRRPDEPTGRARAVPVYRPQLFVALVVLAIATAQIADLNAALRTSDLMSFTLGPSRDAAYATTLERPDGWAVEPVRSIDWASQYFGDGSTWDRYSYVQQSRDASLRAGGVVFADVVTAADRRAMSNYGIESCYTFHDYAIRGRRSVDLGSGVTGVTLSWVESGSGTGWTSVYWHWPVRDERGLHYERITLISRTDGDVFAAPLTGEPKLARSLQLDAADDMRGRVDGADREVEERQRFLTAFARELVARRTAVS